MKKLIYMIAAAAVAIPVVALAQGACGSGSCSKGDKDMAEAKEHMKEGAKAAKDAASEKMKEGRQAARDAYEKGKEIHGLDAVTESVVFHAGTAKKDGKIVTNGGRVLGITATAPTLDEAIQKAYADVKKISFDKAHYRLDIGIKKG